MICNAQDLSCMVKMNRLMDASFILSKRSDLPNGIFVKPDMTPEEQRTEALLLKERWLLMQKGINKNDIKLKLSCLYVQGKKYAEVTNSNLIKKFTPAFPGTPTDSNTTMAHVEARDSQSS